MPTAKWGTWGYGDGRASDLTLNSPYSTPGYYITIIWSDLQPASGIGGYNWDALDVPVARMANAGLYFGFQIAVGQSSPDWVLNHAQIGHFTTNAAGSLAGPYPCYLQDKYKELYYQMYTDVNNHIATWNGTMKSFCSFWSIVEGTTGDDFAYKGTPISGTLGFSNPAAEWPNGYAISFPTWKAFRYAAWDAVEARRVSAGNSFVKFLFNAGNDAEHFQRIFSVFPTADIKQGTLSHDVFFDGEAVYFPRRELFANAAENDNRVRAEMQQTWSDPGWQNAPLPLTWCLIHSARTGGLDIFNMPSGYISQNTTDPRPTNFQNQYAGPRTATASNQAWLHFKDTPSFENTVRFSTGTYGPVITPGSETAYANAIANVNAKDDSESYKAWLRFTKLQTFFNASRITAIKNDAVLVAAGYLYDPTNIFHKDMGIQLSGNYGEWATQFDPDGTSEGRQRVGIDPTGGIYGMRTRQPKLTNGIGSIYVSINSAIGIAGRNDVLIKLAYFDVGRTIWSVRCATLKGLAEIKVIQNAATNTWKQISVTLNGFLFGGQLPNTSDIIIKVHSGGNTQFDTLELKNNSKSV